MLVLFLTYAEAHFLQFTRVKWDFKLIDRDLETPELYLWKINVWLDHLWPNAANSSDKRDCPSSLTILDWWCKMQGRYGTQSNWSRNFRGEKPSAKNFEKCKSEKGMKRKTGTAGYVILVSVWQFDWYEKHGNYTQDGRQIRREHTKVFW